MKRQNVRTLSLIVGTFTYLLLGATVFERLESEHESIHSQNFSEVKLEIMKNFNMTEADFNDIQAKILYNKPYGTTTQWKFAGSFYFATTVITTIGYGHSTPKTVSGKYFCMAYAMPGIPLCIIMFQSIGERMNTFITWLLRRLKMFLGKKDRKVSQTHLIIISSSLGILVLTCGAYVFKKYEQWSYQDSFYYCFITLTTIGFGDFVALQRNNTMMKNPKYVAFSLIFILFGLTVVSSVMNLLVLRFLTMNTEDERRDELEAAAQALDLQRLHGDVIFAMDSDTQEIVAEKTAAPGQNNVEHSDNLPDCLENLSDKPKSRFRNLCYQVLEFFGYIPIFLGWKDDPKNSSKRGYSYTAAHVISVNDARGNRGRYIFSDDNHVMRPAYDFVEEDNYQKCYKYLKDHNDVLVRECIQYNQTGDFDQRLNENLSRNQFKTIFTHPNEEDCHHCDPDLLSMTDSSSNSSTAHGSFQVDKKRASV